jgi:hypothetical protein
MKFYRVSRTGRISWTVVFIFVAIVDLGKFFDGRRWTFLLVLVYAGIQLYTIWNCYWEITPDGIIKSKGYGFELTYRAADLRYAGPVREEYRFPVSRKRDIELQLAGGRTKRYARVAERSAFLEHLRYASPGAEVVSV